MGFYPEYEFVCTGCGQTPSTRAALGKEQQ